MLAGAGERDASRILAGQYKSGDVAQRFFGGARARVAKLACEWAKQFLSKTAAGADLSPGNPARETCKLPPAARTKHLLRHGNDSGASLRLAKF